MESYCEALRNRLVEEIVREEIDTLAVPLASIVRRWQAVDQIRDDIKAEDLAHYLISMSVGIKLHLLMRPDLDMERFQELVEIVFLDGIWSKSRSR